MPTSVADKTQNVAFVVDTSCGMEQILLDVKKTIFNFVNFVNKKRNSNTQYLLVDFGSPEECTKASWSSEQEFLSAVQDLEIKHLPDLGGAMANAFRLLRTRDKEMEIRNYGKGWLPWKQKTTVIICLTCAQNTIQKTENGFKVCSDICFPKRSNPGESLDSEWWDWSTRVFIGRIRFPSASKTQGIKIAQIDDIHASCHSDSITVWNNLTSSAQIEKWLRCISRDFCTKRVLLAEFSDASKMQTQKVQRNMIVIPTRAKGTWPIPEEYPVSNRLLVLRPRKPFPRIRIRLEKQGKGLPPSMIGQFPLDEYEVPHNLSTLISIEGLQNPLFDYRLYIFDSLRERQFGKPFGYLKFDPKKNKIYMVICPYDFPWLFDHLHCYVFHSSKNWSQGLTLVEWRSLLESYLMNIPPYYVSIICRELTKVIPQAFIPSIGRLVLSASVKSTLQEVELFWKKKSAKVSTKASKDINNVSYDSKSSISRKDIYKHMNQLRQNLLDQNSDHTNTTKKSTFGEENEEDLDHNLPVKLMGNIYYYNDKLKRKGVVETPPLRDPFDFLDSKKSMTVLGGNPYRRSKKKSAYPTVQFPHKRKAINKLEDRPSKKQKIEKMKITAEKMKVSVEKVKTIPEKIKSVLEKKKETPTPEQ